jgi:uncharacterized MAPEG superfamily protein
MDWSPEQILLLGIPAAAITVYLPYLVVAYGRFQVGFDPSAPRALFDKLPAYAKRATWAHQNSWEVFALFVAGDLMVYVTDRASTVTSVTVGVFLVARVLFSLFYILDLPWLRSPMWLVSVVCTAVLMSISLSQS